LTSRCAELAAIPCKPSRVGTEKAGGAQERRTLSGSIRPEQPDNFAAANLERYAVNGGFLTVSLREPVNA
jgi:hypothetical protein